VLFFIKAGRVGIAGRESTRETPRQAFKKMRGTACFGLKKSKNVP
jgi:hypothetical protein